MKNSTLILILLLLFVSINSCTTEDTREDDPISLVDCELTELTDPLMNQVAICVSGSDIASPNETLQYISKFDSTSAAADLEILWTVISGNMEIVSIENSTEGGIRKSIASIQFSANFSGGQITVKGLDDNTEEFAEFSKFPIELRN